MASIVERLSAELAAKPWQVEAAVGLLDGGSTVPFIARYRKEATGQLDDTQLRKLDERLRYLRELEERRKAILESIESQGKLDDALRATSWRPTTRRGSKIFICPSSPSAAPRRRSPSRPASRRSPRRCSRHPEREPEGAGRGFRQRREECRDVEAALEGARAILVERFAEDADLIGALREAYLVAGDAEVEAARRQGDGGREISPIISNSREPLREASVASHSGDVPRREGGDARARDGAEPEPGVAATRAASRGASTSRIAAVPATNGCSIRRAGPGAPRSNCISPSMCASRLWRFAEDEAIRVFADNLRDLLLAAPAGARATLGLDPGFRTGVKVAVVDAHRQDRRDDGDLSA